MGRPKKDESEKVKTFGVSLLSDEIDEVIQMAKADHRNPGWLGGKLLLRGMAAYKRDGMFEEAEVVSALTTQRIAAMPKGLNLNESERDDRKPKLKRKAS